MKAKFAFPVLCLWMAASPHAWAALSITCAGGANHGMTFPSVYAGNGAQAVAAANSANAAICTIAGGSANTAWALVSGTPVAPGSMTGPGAAISITPYTTASGSGTFKTSGAGGDTLYVGGTMAAIPDNQVRWTYTSGNITVSIQVGGGAPTRSSTFTASVVTKSPIGVTNSTALDFGEAATDAIAKTINPASSSGRATFSVTGEPSTAYNITLPGSATMKKGAGGTADTEIAVSSFTSSPASPGTLSGAGAQTLYIGATRAAIRSTQSPGTYTVTFTITVAYP